MGTGNEMYLCGEYPMGGVCELRLRIDAPAMSKVEAKIYSLTGGIANLISSEVLYFISKQSGRGQV